MDQRCHMLVYYAYIPMYFFLLFYVENWNKRFEKKLNPGYGGATTFMFIIVDVILVKLGLDIVFTKIIISYIIIILLFRCYYTILYKCYNIISSSQLWAIVWDYIRDDIAVAGRTDSYGSCPGHKHRRMCVLIIY